jgi:hypothetical protein
MDDITWIRTGESATVEEHKQGLVSTHTGPIITSRTTRGVRQRIGTDELCDAVPVRSHTWGALKLVYR